MLDIQFLNENQFSYHNKKTGKDKSFPYQGEVEFTLLIPIKYKYLLQKPIVPAELYRAVRDSQLVGMSGYSREVLLFF